MFVLLPGLAKVDVSLELLGLDHQSSITFKQNKQKGMAQTISAPHLCNEVFNQFLNLSNQPLYRISLFHLKALIT